MKDKKVGAGIQPTGHHVLVKPDKIQEKTDGGIYLAPQTREDRQMASTEGILVATGESAWLEFADGKPWAKVGDIVRYAKYAGVKMNGKDSEKYVLLNDEDILAVLND